MYAYTNLNIIKFIKFFFVKKCASLSFLRKPFCLFYLNTKIIIIIIIIIIIVNATNVNE